MTVLIVGEFTKNFEFDIWSMGSGIGASRPVLPVLSWQFTGQLALLRYKWQFTGQLALLRYKLNGIGF